MPPFRPSRQPPQGAVVFDCDGLLFNTSAAWDRAYTALAASYQASITRADRLALASLTARPLGQALARLLGNPAPPDQLARQLHELVRSNLGARPRPMPGAIELVTALHGTPLRLKRRAAWLQPGGPAGRSRLARGVNSGPRD